MADLARRLWGVVAAVVVALGVATAPLPSAAHSLKVFALVEGQMIKGSVYFSGSAPACGARITVRGPDDALLAEAVSSDDGSFSVPLGPPVDHRIIADAGDGHSATFTVRATELAGDDVSLDPPNPLAPAPENTAAGPVAATGGELEAVVEAVVSRHVTPLREQLNAYEDRLRWHDVLGGIGYILGLTGLAAVFATRRRRGKSAPP